MLNQLTLLRRTLLAGGALLTAPSIVRAQGANGVALVIGNSKYQWEAQLGNVKRDSADIAKAFQAKGLKTELLQEVNRDSFQQAVSKFKTAASGANLAVFYYAGHGASWDKDTYLVPVDADLSKPNIVKTLLPVRDINAAMKGASNRLMVFDSCRNNPADGWRQLAAERQAVFNPDIQRTQAAEADPSSLTLYSTAPGRVALDGPAGQNSPFAALLLRQLGAPTVDLAALPAKLRRELLIATEGRQVLWDSNTYSGPFVLGGGKLNSTSTVAAGWSGDLSRIVELTNAYAYARKNGMRLPEGLIAYRLSSEAKHANKHGSFQFITRGKYEPISLLLIIMSVENNGAAQIILSRRGDGLNVWRFTNGLADRRQLFFRPTYEAPEFVLDWSTRDAGTVSPIGGYGITSSKFARLDG
jgi:hypothetical protein